MQIYFRRTSQRQGWHNNNLPEAIRGRNLEMTQMEIHLHVGDIT